MTPREKAFELLYKSSYTIDKPGNYNETKEIALLIVNEILDCVASHYATIDYWNEVKNEIEKL